MSQEKTNTQRLSLVRRHPEKRSLIDAESALVDWEVDRFLIDRRNVCGYCFASEGAISLFELYQSTRSSPGNLAKILSELLEQQVLIPEGEGAVVLSPIGRAWIVKNRRELFFPRLNRTWLKIPSFISDIHRPRAKQISELPATYRKLKVKK